MPPMFKTILGLMLVSSVAFAAPAETYAKLSCKVVKGEKVCKVAHEKKISGDITYLDMSETEGKSDDMPAITPKGKL